MRKKIDLNELGNSLTEEIKKRGSFLRTGQTAQQIVKIISPILKDKINKVLSTSKIKKLYAIISDQQKKHHDSINIKNLATSLCQNLIIEIYLAISKKVECNETLQEIMTSINSHARQVVALSEIKYNFFYSFCILRLATPMFVKKAKCLNLKPISVRYNRDRYISLASIFNSCATDGLKIDWSKKSINEKFFTKICHINNIQRVDHLALNISNKDNMTYSRKVLSSDCSSFDLTLSKLNLKNIKSLLECLKEAKIHIIEFKLVDIDHSLFSTISSYMKYIKIDEVKICSSETMGKQDIIEFLTAYTALDIKTIDLGYFIINKKEKSLQVNSSYTKYKHIFSFESILEWFNAICGIKNSLLTLSGLEITQSILATLNSYFKCQCAKELSITQCKMSHTNQVLLSSMQITSLEKINLLESIIHPSIIEKFIVNGYCLKVITASITEVNCSYICNLISQLNNKHTPTINLACNKYNNITPEYLLQLTKSQHNKNVNLSIRFKRHSICGRTVKIISITNMSEQSLKKQTSVNQKHHLFQTPQDSAIISHHPDLKH